MTRQAFSERNHAIMEGFDGIPCYSTILLQYEGCGNVGSGYEPCFQLGVLGTTASTPPSGTLRCHHWNGLVSFPNI